MALATAVRKGDYEECLRLLYLNPFVSRREKSDALWHCVATAKIPLLRMLLETGTKVYYCQFLLPLYYYM